MRISDWSSDVCSSDLPATGPCIQRLSDRKSRQNRRVQRLLRRGWWIWRAARWHGPAHCQRLSTHPPERSYRTREHHLSGSYAAPTDIFLGFPCNCRQKSAVLMTRTHFRSIAIALSVAATGMGAVLYPQIQGDRSEEHTSELQSLMRISYAVFCLKKKIQITKTKHHIQLLKHS